MNKPKSKDEARYQKIANELITALDDKSISIQAITLASNKMIVIDKINELDISVEAKILMGMTSGETKSKISEALDRVIQDEERERKE